MCAGCIDECCLRPHRLPEMFDSPALSGRGWAYLKGSLDRPRRFNRKASIIFLPSVGSCTASNLVPIYCSATASRCGSRANCIVLDLDNLGLSSLVILLSVLQPCSLPLHYEDFCTSQQRLRWCPTSPEVDHSWSDEKPDSSSGVFTQRIYARCLSHSSARVKKQDQGSQRRSEVRKRNHQWQRQLSTFRNTQRVRQEEAQELRHAS